jgi:exonuclease III
MKIMNYNILHGFHSNEQPFVLQKDRLKAAQEVVKQENPDVLVLTEACFGAENKYGINMDYKKLFDFPHAIYSLTASEWGSSLLSKYPIVSSGNYSMDRRSFSRNILDVNGKEVCVDIAHPHPDLNEFEKRRFFHSQLRDIPNVPYILTGDFNALSPQDTYDKEKLIQGFAKFMKNEEDARKAIEGFMTYQAISEITKQGLVDTYRQIHKEQQQYTIPTDYLSSDKNSGVRIDYIFCSPHFKVEDAKVIQTKDSNSASDHYPVTSILKLRGKN